MNYRKSLCIALAIALSYPLAAQLPVKIKSIPVSNVRLTDSPFKHAQNMDISYLMALNPDRLLAPYLKEARLTPKAENYTNWENTGLDGHIGGHYLSALSHMYAATGNEEIKRRLDYMLSEFKRCQDASKDGYLCGVPNGRQIWNEIKRGDIRASGFGLNDRWVPLYNIHKIYAGLRDAYLLTNNNEAKEMLIKLTDWMINLISGLTEEQIQDMLRSEHGGLNEVFADVAAITGDKRYLKLAHQFSHQIILDPLLDKKDVMTGMHANTQIPKAIGFKRIADVEGNEQWNEAAKFFWETVMKNRSISIGGNSVREHFHPTNDFSSMLTSEQGPETCNTYNMLRMTKMLYETSADVTYMDYYERALYNHILSTINPLQGGFVYFTPMRAGHYRVYSQPQTSFWCCVGSGMENHARYGEMIYGYNNNDLYVNLFIPSVLNWKNAVIEQKTNFPYKEETRLIINPRKSNQSFTINIRIPEWINQNEIHLDINGETQKANLRDGFISVNRTWHKGDEIALQLPMHLRAIQLPDNSGNFSILYGPIVLASRLGKQNQDGMYADDSRGGHIANGPRLPLQDMPVIVDDKENILTHITKSAEKPLTFNLTGVYPNKYEGMVLEPFFNIHECRYMVYWPVITKAELEHKQQQIAEQERERIVLDAKTADQVISGEQQPESDHFIETQQSWVGDEDGTHWRETNSWFSYRMKRNSKDITKVRLLYKSPDKRDARILLDGNEIGIITGNANNQPTVQDIMIPEPLRSKEQLTIKISKGNSDVTPRILEVRLLTE